MVNSVLTGISQALYAEFGYRIYSDGVEQNLKPPCFLITPLTLSEKHIINERYERNFHYIIQYFPKSKKYHIECNEVTERLMNILHEVITDNGIIRSKGDMKSEVHDGVLMFEVKYSPLVVKVKSNATEDSELMGSLTQINNIKE